MIKLSKKYQQYTHMAINYKPVSYIKKNRRGEDEEVVIPGYQHATYAGLNVIINKDGLFNLSKICYLYVSEDGRHNKKFSEWKGTLGNQELIDSFERLHLEEDGNPNKFLVEVMNAPIQVRGTYGIEEIAIQVAGYTIKEFAWKISKIAKDYYKKEAEQKIQKLTADKTELQTTVTELNAKMDAMLAQGRQVLGKLDDVQDELGDVKEELTLVNTRVEVLVKEVVPPNKYKDLEERVGIMRLNDPNHAYQYKAYRVQKCHVDRAESDIIKDFPNAELWRKTGTNPNSVNCLNRLKELYRRGKSGQLVFSYNSIKLNNGTTEAQFENMIDEILAQPATYGKPENSIVAASTSKTKKTSDKST